MLVDERIIFFVQKKTREALEGKNLVETILSIGFMALKERKDDLQHVLEDKCCKNRADLRR